MDLGTAEPQGVVASSQGARGDPTPSSRWLRGRGTTTDSAPLGSATCLPRLDADGVRLLQRR